MFSFAELVPLGFRGLCLLGLKGKQTKNLKRIKHKINSCSRTDLTVRNSFLCREHNIFLNIKTTRVFCCGGFSCLFFS